MIQMGLFKTIIIVAIVVFIISAMFIWFPEQTMEILGLIYKAGIKLVKLIWRVISKLASAIIEWLYANK